jgi:hypothetical protein
MFVINVDTATGDDEEQKAERQQQLRGLLVMPERRLLAAQPAPHWQGVAHEIQYVSRQRKDAFGVVQLPAIACTQSPYVAHGRVGADDLGDEIENRARQEIEQQPRRGKQSPQGLNVVAGMLTRASQSVAIKLTYAIVSDADLRDASAQLAGTITGTAGRQHTERVV